MSKYRLIQVSPHGRCTEIAYSQDVEQLKATGSEAMERHTDMEYGIVDEDGYFVWPEKHADKEPQYAENIH